MNYQIKLITTDEDREKTKNLWLSHEKMMRTKMERDPDFIDKCLRYPGTETYGAFVDDRLVATVSIIIWKKLPQYIVNGHVVDKGVNKLYNFKKNNPLGILTNYAVKRMEERGYFSVYFVQSITPGYNKLYKTGGDILRNIEIGWDHEKNQYRYHQFFEEIIPAGKESKFEIFNDMIDYHIYNVNIVVIQAILKNEYRPWGDVFLDGDKYFIKKEKK
jgi:hypothetical protein